MESNFILCMVAATIVALIQVVGLILIIALSTLPAAIASQFVGSVAATIVTSCVLGAAFGCNASDAGDLTQRNLVDSTPLGKCGCP